MCFSATASFVIAGGLSLVGLLSLRSVKIKKQYPLAMIPFFFAMQQAAEGVVWLTLNSDHQVINKAATLLYMGFAMAFWPMWIPFALFILERRGIRKKILRALYVCGGIVAGYSYYRLFSFPVNVEIFKCNLLYFIEYQRAFSPNFYLLLYCIPTVISFFVSSFSLMWLFGLIITGILFLTYMMWYAAFISVWCFFAAVLSVLILIGLRLHKN